MNKDEYIERLNPKPSFNLKWYKGEDLYSDGQIEDVVIDIIANNAPERYEDAIEKAMCWPVYYHLTNIRQNILNWYPFDKSKNALEIGCGMGAITNALCERLNHVTAVELSKNRALGTLLRCRERSNLEIIVGNLNDIEFEEKFDYITLIGVLEYQGSYTDSGNPYVDFLKKIKGLLKPDGKLLIAIENQFGLKYWCGATEDHTGIPFDGMNMYKLSNQSGVRTFSKQALTQLINESGFSNTYFYYPLPDYKLPTIIYSQNYLPKKKLLDNMECYYFPTNKYMIANERDLYSEIIQNGAFEFFANSFLVECAETEDIGKSLFAVSNSLRCDEYQVGTRINSNGTVDKYPLCGEIGCDHLGEVLANEEFLINRGLNVLRSRNMEEYLQTDFVDLPTMEDLIGQAFLKRDKEEILRLIDMAVNDIMASSPEVPAEDNMCFSLGLSQPGDGIDYGPILQYGFMDMIHRNCFVDGNNLMWFDQEWRLENIPAKLLIYKFIVYLDVPKGNIGDVVSYTELASKYGIDKKICDLGSDLEAIFSKSIIDQKRVAERCSLANSDMQAIADAIGRLVK